MGTLKERTLQTFASIASFAIGVSAVAGIYALYRNNIWRPSVTINNVDWDQGIAGVTINGNTNTLYAGSDLAAGASWAIRFAQSATQSTGYGRIELIKNSDVYDYLAQRSS